MLLGSSAASQGIQDSAEEAYFARWEEKHQTRLADMMIKVTGSFSLPFVPFTLHLVRFLFLFVAI